MLPVSDRHPPGSDRLERRLVAPNVQRQQHTRSSAELPM